MIDNENDRNSARRGRGAAARARQCEPIVFDWDAAIGRLKAMLDDLEEESK